MSYDDHMSTESVARFYPLPHRDRCRIEATRTAVVLHLDALGCEFTAQETAALIEDLTAAQRVVDTSHEDYVHEGWCPSMHRGHWCAQHVGHDGHHRAPIEPDPTMPVDRLTNPNRIEWT